MNFDIDNFTLGQLKQAEYDRAEERWENRRDADLEGGAV